MCVWCEHKEKIEWFKTGWHATVLKAMQLSFFNLLATGNSRQESLIYEVIVRTRRRYRSIGTRISYVKNVDPAAESLGHIYFSIIGSSDRHRVIKLPHSGAHAAELTKQHMLRIEH